MDSSAELLYFLLSYLFPKQLSDPDLLDKMLTIAKENLYEILSVKIKVYLETIKSISNFELD